MQGTAKQVKPDTRKKHPDAGLKANEHYSRRLPPWRYHLREALLPLIRWETPYLHALQRTVRSPALDSYFAMVANLGTHTFYMVFLPLLYWCGYTTAARALIHMLALGVFFSGWLKDMVCLPRPLSPPLQRISMSGSAILEYGFPSTHATNAVSVIIWLIHGIHTGLLPVEETLLPYIIGTCYLYAISIIAGRLYCGMHGFTDVTVGGIIGVLCAVVQIAFESSFDKYVAEAAWPVPVMITVIVVVAVHFHSQPADNCPCFMDSVSFAGVIIGIEAGHTHFAKLPMAWSVPTAATVPFALHSMGLIRTVLRLLIGVAAILVWRPAAKAVFLTALPPLFRQIEYIGLDLPRRFFESASQYTKVPPLRRDDNIIPQAKDISAFFSTLGSGGRKRTVSVGPQSEADAREMMAQRELQRKHSWKTLKLQVQNGEIATGPSTAVSPTDGPELSPLPPQQDGTPAITVSDAEQDKALLEGMERPRTSYDVEVVTKLIVYTGIGWIAAEGGPLLFELIGLGMP